MGVWYRRRLIVSDWSDFWIEYAGERRTSESFGPTFLPELLRVVEEHAPRALSFLEWGTGLSTLLLARVAAERGGSLVTVDHEGAYARSVVARLAPPAKALLVVADLTGPKLSQGDEGLNYGTAPLALGKDYDFVLVDGRRRVECALNAFFIAQPSTVVTLHDYRRRRYQHVSVLFDTLEAGDQFLVLRAKPDLLRATAAERERLIRVLRHGA